MTASSRPLTAFAAEYFERVPGYLDTAAVGLPPRVSMRAFRERLNEWEEGRCHPQSFDPDVARARAAYAVIAGTDVSLVGSVSQVSVVTGLVAASLPEGARVLCAEEDFTSVLFPFLVDDRLEVQTVPVADLFDRLDSGFDLVAVSAVQSSSGVVTDLDRLAAVAGEGGVRTFVDVTQAAGWLPIDAGRFEVTACHAYKWLCAPRGAAFLTVSPEAMEWLHAPNAGWYAGEDPWGSIYGRPLRLAADARRFDTSPAWFSYAAAAPGLELLAGLDIAEVNQHSVGLANTFRELVGLQPSDSAIVSLSTPAGPDLAAGGIAASARAGRARLSFYLYNTIEDAERAASIVGRVS